MSPLRLAVTVLLLIDASSAYADCVAGEQILLVPARTAHRLLSEFIGAGSPDRLTKGGFFEDGRCRVSVSAPVDDGGFKVEVIERVVGTNFGRHAVVVAGAVPVKVACSYLGDARSLKLVDVISLGQGGADGWLVNSRGPARFVQVPNPDVLAYYVPKVVRCEANP